MAKELDKGNGTKVELILTSVTLEIIHKSVTPGNIYLGFCPQRKRGTIAEL